MRHGRRLNTSAYVIASDGVRIAWQRFAQNGVARGTPPLLLIQGFACGKDDWGALTKMLASTCKRDVISFDHRGVGESDVPDRPYTVQEMALDALQVAKAAGADRVHVLGISLGGMIAQELALENPSLVSSLVLGCTTHGGREATSPPKEFMKLCMDWSYETSGEANASACVPEFMQFMLPEGTSPTLVEHFGAAFIKTTRTRAGLRGQVGPSHSQRAHASLKPHACSHVCTHNMRARSRALRLTRKSATRV